METILKQKFYSFCASPDEILPTVAVHDELDKEYYGTDIDYLYYK